MSISVTPMKQVLSLWKYNKGKNKFKGDESGMAKIIHINSAVYVIRF
jgi:hypothetical protein